MIVMTDVALDPYSIYGHAAREDGEIVNDPTVEALIKMSLSHVQAGADWVAPANMRWTYRRDPRGFEKTTLQRQLMPIAPNCVLLLRPFRLHWIRRLFGDKKTYQMDYANRLELSRKP